ncbi:MAG TPA: hypothetical protein VMB72_12685 [Acidimicrobiales bacterium]|nr:hypothetical protein [Acidimicrobiales bacterium]
MRRLDLEEERAHLLDSLTDLDRERDAGDLSDEDYRALRDRYVRRTARVLRALDEGHGAGAAAPGAPGAEATARPAPPPHEPGPRRPRRRRRGLAVGGVTAIAAAVALLVVSTHTSARLPDQTPTGTVRLSPGEQRDVTLAQAETLEAQGQDARAVVLYRQVLAGDPDQADALAELAWLEYQAAVSARDGTVLATAQRQEERAARLAPSDDAPHLYLGTMLLAGGDAAGAADQFGRFLADHPATATVRQAWALVTEAYTRAGRPAPSFPGA